MTFDERVQALAPLGFTPRQTRFLATVALHGGFCLRRQYATFAGIKYGEHVREFLDALVKRELARRVSYKRNRGFVYHVHAKSLYRAIAQEDNRNRRVASPALIARKLMLLDLVIATPHVEWLAAEEDKVAFFTTRLAVPMTELPQRTYEAATSGASPTVRAFVHKLPIYLTGEPLTPHFVCFADGVGEGGCETFLRDHSRLLHALGTWTLVAIGPAGASDFRSSERAFKQVVGEAGSPLRMFDTPDLRWYCETRRTVEAKQFDRLTVAAIDRFRDLRRRLEGPLADRLYQEWLTSGDSAFDLHRPGIRPRQFHGARFEARVLPHRYTQFGDLPGMC